MHIYKDFSAVILLAAKKFSAQLNSVFRAYFSYTSKVKDYTLEKLTQCFCVAIKEKMAEQLQKEDLIAQEKYSSKITGFI